ncbi:MAG: Aliphatic sulfonates family ABC transporter, periplasmic ligand-binding protein [Parcubacteria group bacterium GW2011_GWA2_46_9]|nr:MAG: Aliphatic sulfonates family ABC transporter, periplasmic ligand-binding protein [Parcubacteria group bacterium GW2011_GWA2_46_9]
MSKSMLKRINIAAVAVIVILTLVFGWQVLYRRLEPVDLNFVVTSWPASRLIYAVESRGLFKKYGLKVKIIDVGGNYERAVEALRQGEADGGSFVLSEPLRLTAEGLPIKVVASIDYSSGADGIVAVPDIQSLQDLRGRRVAVPVQGFGHLLFQEALRRAALSEDDVIIVPQEPLGAVRAFLAHRVDAVVSVEPYLSLAVARRQSHLLFSSAETPGLISNVIAFREEYVLSHPKKVAAFLRAWFDVIDYFEHGEAERQEVMAIAAIASGVTLANLEDEFRGIELLNFAGNAIAFTYGNDITSLYGSGERLLEFLESTGRILKPVSVFKVLEPSFIRSGLR